MWINNLVKGTEMDRIKKRLLDAVKNLQLAKNEKERLLILGKPVGWDNDLQKLTDSLVHLSNDLKNV